MRFALKPGASPEERTVGAVASHFERGADVEVSCRGDAAFSHPYRHRRGAHFEQRGSGHGAPQHVDDLSDGAQGWGVGMACHEEQDTLTQFKASILTTPEWQKARKSRIPGLMAGKPKKLRPEQNLLLGRRLKLTRRALGQSQKAFAAEAGVSPESYNQWENGAVYPPVEGATKLVKAHKLTLDWIYLAVPDRLPAWLAKAIEALADADAAGKQPDRAKDEDADVTVVQPRRHGRSAA